MEDAALENIFFLNVNSLKCHDYDDNDFQLTGFH